MKDHYNGRNRISRWLAPKTKTSEKALQCFHCRQYHETKAQAEADPCCGRMALTETSLYCHARTYQEWCENEVARLTKKGKNAVIEDNKEGQIAVYTA